MKIKLTDKRVANHPAPASGQVDLFDTLTPGMYLRVGPRKRAFYVAHRVNGKQKRTRIGTYPATSLSDARERARDIMAGADTPAAAMVSPKVMTVHQAAAIYVRDHVSRIRTADKTRHRFEAHIIPVLGDLMLVELRRLHVKEFMAHVRKFAPKSSNRYLNDLRAFLNWCVDEELIDANPAARIKAEKERARERVLSPDELRAVWNAAGALEYPFGPYFRMLLLTGLRRSEAAGMQWRHLDLENGLYTLPPESSKSGLGRTVPLSSAAVVVLADCPHVGEYAFASGRTEKPISGFSKAKARLDKAAKVDDWVIHDLRRSVATHLRRLGVDRLVVSMLLGHAESGVTSVYDRHGLLDEQRAALEQWAGYLERIASGKAAKVLEIAHARTAD